MKYRSLEQGTMGMEVAPSREPYYPSIHVSEKQLPGLKDKDVGDKCEIMIRAKVSNIGKDGYTLEMMQIGSHEEYEKEEA